MRSNKMEILKNYRAYKNVEARELNVVVVRRYFLWMVDFH